MLALPSALGPFLALTLMACSGGSATSRPIAGAAPTKEACTQRFLRAIEERDGEALAAAAHPEKGVRFTVWGFVKPDTDHVMNTEALRRAFTDTNEVDWGREGESDDRVHETPGAFLTTYVHDPAKPIDPAPSAAIAPYEAAMFDVSALQETLASVYPAGTVVELRRPESQVGAHDWQIVRIVCEPHDGGQYVVAAVHNAWSP